jgi:hypothetical protein
LAPSALSVRRSFFAVSFCLYYHHSKPTWFETTGTKNKVEKYSRYFANLFCLHCLHLVVNKATIIGRVGQDAEMNTHADRTVVHFSVATSENHKDTEGTVFSIVITFRLFWDKNS